MLKSKIASVFLMCVLFLSTISAQTYIDKGDYSMRVKYTTSVDSLATMTSNWFSVADYLPGSLITYPAYYTKIQSSVLRVPVITVTLEGSNDQTNYVVVDTIGTVGDSLETIYSGNINLNNQKFWFYRIKAVGVGAHPFDNARDAVLRTDLIFVRPKD